MSEKDYFGTTLSTDQHILYMINITSGLGKRTRVIGRLSPFSLWVVCLGLIVAGFKREAPLFKKETQLSEKSDVSADSNDGAYVGFHALPDTLQQQIKVAQVTGWGVKQVGSAKATGKKVWIIDSGVCLKHPDLVVDAALSCSFVKQDSTQSAEDDNGHGTMIAGIIAAKDNGFGVKGIAAGATVVAVKVLNARAKGSYDDLIAGIYYTVRQAQPDEVAVICIGGPVWGKLDEAVLALAEKGIRVVVSAGNHAAFASDFSPTHLSHQNIYVVAGMDRSFNLLPESNFGSPPITHCAPGKDILSTSLHNSYGLDSGSSMAAPHVAGLLLINDCQVNSVSKAFCMYDQRILYPVASK